MQRTLICVAHCDGADGIEVAKAGLLLDDARFQADVHNTVVFTVCFLVLSIALGFAAALLLDQKLPATRLFQNVVQPTGQCTDVQVVHSLDPTFGLDQEAVKAAKQWRFKPGTRLGQPVPVLVTIELSFALR